MKIFPDITYGDVNPRHPPSLIASTIPDSSYRQVGVGIAFGPYCHILERLRMARNNTISVLNKTGVM